jgi:23S rRNA (adenine2030-N6)-methyltransferase
MNYRHAYHAGNFADVVKHAILARVLTYMKQKPQPFRVIDTHAGSGRYDLGGVEAGKTGEWRDGIARLIDAEIPAEVAALLAPYLDAVRSVNMPGELTFYPGSPVIAHFLMRPGDSLVANELHGEDLESLKGEFHRVDGTKVLGRGVILIDPPFESPDEFERLTESLGHALRRFASGVYLVWYPVKNQAASNRFVQEVSQLGCSKMLDVRLTISEPFAGLGLTETGLLILNPPFSLKGELEVLLPFLSELLAEGRGAGFRLADDFNANQDIV